MRILVVTDAWRPQVNGVVRSLESVARALTRAGEDIVFLTPEGFPTFPLPTYHEIRLAFALSPAVGRRMDALACDHVHIATEGPLGLAARRICITRGEPFTTSYHTRFPEYLHARTRFPLNWSYAALRLFHNAGAGMMVATESLARELSTRGFLRPMLWSRGVDHELFRPRDLTLSLPRPVFLYVGRIAPEKNLEAFLRLDLPGSKLLVGDGPDRETLARLYPDAHFAGVKKGEDLARLYAGADAFVFPSRTDTFGVVLLEALASGLPVAAFPVQGPADVIGDSKAGMLSEDLLAACLAALEIPRGVARERALQFAWDASARQFASNIAKARSDYVRQKMATPSLRNRVAPAPTAPQFSAPAVPQSHAGSDSRDRP
ncbi:MAG: glycosyltransferase family 1 protein [Beijerinckiaceae bacterium]